jgi:hypothetical protein
MKFLKPFEKVLRRFAVTALPLLSVAAVAVAGSVILKASHAQELTPSDAGASTVQYATTATSDCCSITVDKLASAEVAGMKRVTASVTIVNNGSAVLQISPGLQFFMVDAKGIVYPYTADYLAAGAVTGGPIAGGGRATEQLDFALPIGTVPHIMSFQRDAGTPAVIVGLSS